MRRWSFILVAVLLVLLPTALVVERGRESREAANLAAALRRDGEAWAGNPWPRPPLPGETVEGHALDHYRAALDYVVLFDVNALRALAAWHRDRTPIPSGFRPLLHEARPGLERLSMGTRTFSVGRRAGPEEAPEELAGLTRLANAAEIDAVVALTDGDPGSAIRRAAEMMRLGFDLARGGDALHQHSGRRIAGRGLRILELLAGGKGLSAADREAILTRLSVLRSGKRTPGEMLDGISLQWQRELKAALTGSAGSWNRDGSGWGSNLPRFVNPQYVTDAQFLEAWRMQRDTVSRLRRKLENTRYPMNTIRGELLPGTFSKNRVYADSCAELLRTLLALLRQDRDLRHRMAKLEASLGKP